MSTTEALVVAAHGSHLDPDADVPAFDHADAVRRTGAFDEVRAAFWKEEPSLREVLRTLASEVVYVVPLFTSEGYFTRRVVPRELRLDDNHALDVEKDVRYTDPVGTHDALTGVIVDRARTVTGDTTVGPGVGLAVVGHGTDRHADSDAATRAHADRIRERGRFDEVRALFLDEVPTVESVTERFDASDVVVVPLFVADGYHTEEDVPAAMGILGDRPGEYDVPATVDGTRIWYAGAVGTEPTMATIVAERAADAGATVDPADVRAVIEDGPPDRPTNGDNP